MAALFRMIEASLLCAMGTFMVVLSQSSVYWQFLNPKYSWLTLVSGTLLVIIGFACLLNTQKQRKVSEFVGILTFLFLAGTAIVSFEYMVEPDSDGGSLTREYTVDEMPSVRLGNTEYVKINSAELLLGEQEGMVSVGQAYAIQGAVIRSQKLDRAGYIGIGRLYITCCFADSIGVVTLVKVSDPEIHTHGSWARALGVIEENVPLSEETIALNGALTAIRSEKYTLRATEVTEQSVQGVPFIFEVRNTPPFAY